MTVSALLRAFKGLDQLVKAHIEFGKLFLGFDFRVEFGGNVGAVHK